MRRLALVVLAGVVAVTPAHAARLFNGTSDTLTSASAVNLSAFTKVVYGFWLWWDVNSNDGKYAMDLHTGAAHVITVQPNSASGSWTATIQGNVGIDDGLITRPSAVAWHHFVINFDLTKSSAEVDSIYVDGVSQTVTRFNNADNASIPSGTFYAMANTGVANFGAGRLAEFAIWGGINFTQTDVSALYNGGAGNCATNVQRGALVDYWRLLGESSPEPATVGGINLTVTGATQTTHPVTVCTQAPSAARKFPRLGVGGRGRSGR